MAQHVPDLDGITADDLPALTADGLYAARLKEWSLEDGAREAASLANTAGGLIVVGPQDGLTAEALLEVGSRLQPEGEHLVRARTLETPEGTVGLVAVRECADPPVMEGESGAIYHRGEGIEVVHTREALDGLLVKRDRVRARAEAVIDAQIERTALGHASYFTLALIVAPLLPGSQSLDWVRQNTATLLASRAAQRWGLTEGDKDERAGVVEFKGVDDVSGFILAAGNGTLAVGWRDKRPPQDHFLSPSDLADRIDELAEAAQLMAAGGDAGLVLPALYFEGLRELRLEAGDGFGPPCSRDLQRGFLSRRFLETEAAGEALAGEMAAALGPHFGADLVARTVSAFTGEPAPGPSQKTWHGKTLRTERRLAGQRGFGSAR